MKTRMKDTLLLIGDDRLMLRPIFSPSYHLLEAENAEQGAFLLRQNNNCISAVIADIPVVQGEIRKLMDASHPEPDDQIPLLFIISSNGPAHAEEQLLLWGATDVVHKPYAEQSIVRRVQILVDLYHQRLNLEQQVEEKEQIILNFYRSVLDTLAAVIEHRDVDTGHHALRMRGLTQILLRQVAACCPEYGLDQKIMDAIANVAVLHDIGKISVPDTILNKPGRLTPDEMAIMKRHTTVGGDLITRLGTPGDMAYMQYAYNVCLYHHERWNGEGYPKGLKGEEIPICAQVVGLIDVFDALTNERCYREATPHEIAVNMICNGDCGSFSPKLLECFKSICPELIQFSKTCSDNNGEPETIPPLLAPTPDRGLSTMQTTQLKYQSLLHYLDDTVIEVDLEKRLYHVVYNPNPDFVMLFSNSSLDQMMSQLVERGIHPEDLEATAKAHKVGQRELFEENCLKYVLHCRLFNPVRDKYEPYEVTLLRVNTGNDCKVMVVVFHKKEENAATSAAEKKQRRYTDVLYDLSNAALCCSPDESLTILEGGHTLLPLIGYKWEELETQHHGSLMDLVYGDDRALLRDMLYKAGSTGEKQEVQLRLVGKTDTPIWALCRGRISTMGGKDAVYLTLTDIQMVKEDILRLGRDYLRNRLIVGQFRNVIIEWNLITDDIFVSEQWEERFGYPLPGKNFSRMIASGANIHPDDLPALREKIQGLREEEGKDYLDLRISDSGGRYRWSRLRAVSKAEMQDKPTCIVAVLYDIHELKDSVLAMQEKMQQDALTKLLNKDSVRRVVNKHLDNMQPGEKAALLMLDIDNFKLVNDTRGHLYGDAVLTQIGTQLRALFRSHDVIGRVGGDEFLIFLQNIPNIEIVRERCALLVETFRKYLHNLMPNLDVSVSVGCALVPQHGKTWAELYQNADTALYMAKNKGKCQYSIYTPEDKLTKHGILPTRIDSDEQPVVNDDAFMRFAFHSLYTSRDVEKTIESLMEHIGTRFNVSRVYIFENNDANTHCNNTFEWCNVNIEPQKDMLQNVSYETDAPNWPSYFDDNGVMYCQDVEMLPEEIRQILQPQGIKSMLHCAIMNEGVFRGYVGFDDCVSGCLWTQEQITLLEFFAEILSVFLYRHREKQKIAKQAIRESAVQTGGNPYV